MDSDYLTYRGKCKEMAEAAAAEEFRPLRRDSLCPSGAAFVSTMPAPSGDSGGATR